jgi:CheY-like chemotaxis protein
MTLLDYCAAFDILADAFATAEEAVESLQTSLARSRARYDLIVIEPEALPGMGAYAFCSWFRQQMAHQDQLDPPTLRWQTRPHESGLTLPTEIIVISADPDPEECAAFGADRCFSKPFSPQCFASAILAWLSARESSRNAGARGASGTSAERAPG